MPPGLKGFNWFVQKKFYLCKEENSDIDIYYEGKSLGLKSLVEFPEKLEKFFGVPVDVVRKHNNLRPSSNILDINELPKSADGMLRLN